MSRAPRFLWRACGPRRAELYREHSTISAAEICWLPDREQWAVHVRRPDGTFCEVLREPTRDAAKQSAAHLSRLVARESDRQRHGVTL